MSVITVSSVAFLTLLTIFLLIVLKTKCHYNSGLFCKVLLVGLIHMIYITFSNYIRYNTTPETTHNLPYCDDLNVSWTSTVAYIIVCAVIFASLFLKSKNCRQWCAAYTFMFLFLISVMHNVIKINLKIDMDDRTISSYCVITFDSISDLFLQYVFLYLPGTMIIYRQIAGTHTVKGK